jgi:hypothetical protein
VVPNLEYITEVNNVATFDVLVQVGEGDFIYRCASPNFECIYLERDEDVMPFYVAKRIF